MNSPVLMSQRDAHILRSLLSIRTSLPPSETASRQPLSELLDQAREIPHGQPVVPAVGLNDTVTVRFITGTDREEAVFQVVLPCSGDAAEGRISVLAPLSLGVLGRKAGERVTISTPVGNQELEILNIEKAARHADSF